MDSLNYYEKNWAKYIKETINLDMSELYDFFISELKGNRILDFGCGSGRDSLYFKSMNYEVVSSEPCEELRLFSSNLLGKTTLKISYNEIVPKLMNELGNLDGIWGCASLLHCPKEDMSGLLSAFSSLLKKDGVIYCSFINENSGKVIGNRFYNSYSLESFKSLIGESDDLYIYKYLFSSDKRKDKPAREWLNLLLKNK